MSHRVGAPLVVDLKPAMVPLQGLKMPQAVDLPNALNTPQPIDVPVRD